MNIDEVLGKRIAVVMFVEKPGEDDDVIWFESAARIENERLVFDRANRPSFRLPLETLEDIRVCSEAHKQTFEGCELVLPLTIKDLGTGSAEGLEFTGLTIRD